MSLSASSCARWAWSLMSRIRAYSILTRRPVASKYSWAAERISSTSKRVLIGTSSSRSSSSGACSDTARVTGMASLTSLRTAGARPTVRKLVKEAIPVTLAVSLHAPDDELRDELVPINTRFDVDEILSAAHEYFEATGRRVSIEYALIRDINDQAHRAQLLADKLIAKGGLHWA